jgi:hypothetical protein
VNTLKETYLELDWEIRSTVLSVNEKKKTVYGTINIRGKKEAIDFISWREKF